MGTILTIYVSGVVLSKLVGNKTKDSLKWPVTLYENIKK